MSEAKRHAARAASEKGSERAKTEDPAGAGLLWQGWLSVAVWMAFGLLLEGLLGWKIPAYLENDQRRELLRLAHAHGTLLGLVLIAAGITMGRLQGAPRAGALALRGGALVLPLGFLLAGLWSYESDPGLAIWLVPPGALLVIFGATLLALAARGKS